jgi:hypothetical protein
VDLNRFYFFVDLDNLGLSKVSLSEELVFNAISVANIEALAGESAPWPFVSLLRPTLSRYSIQRILDLRSSKQRKLMLF